MNSETAHVFMNVFFVLGDILPFSSARLEASHSEQHQCVKGLPEHLHRRAQHAVQQAVRSLQVLPVPASEDRVEEQRVSGSLPHSGPGPVRRQGSGEAYDGHRVHRYCHTQRGGQSAREDLRISGDSDSTFTKRSQIC